MPWTSSVRLAIGWCTRRKRFCIRAERMRGTQVASSMRTLWVAEVESQSSILLPPASRPARQAFSAAVSSSATDSDSLPISVSPIVQVRVVDWLSTSNTRPATALRTCSAQASTSFMVPRSRMRRKDRAAEAAAEVVRLQQFAQQLGRAA